MSELDARRAEGIVNALTGTAVMLLVIVVIISPRYIRGARS